jgi:tripartite-type tricarboxylate transporter receptor subunit TctC
MNRLHSPVRRALGRLALLAASTLALPAIAAYPEQPIRMIVAYGAGGGTDIVARLLAPYIGKYLGPSASVVVVNRPGAGGAIGFAELAKAAPDGYTVGFINTPNVLTIPIERKAAYHWQDFEVLGNVVDDPGNFSVHADSPFKSLADLVAYAKSRPGEVTYGSTGVGSDDHLSALMLERAAGIQMTHVPFKGTSEVHNAVLSKQITVAAMNIGEALQYVKGGSKIRQLGQMSESRTTLAPQVPTFKEQGYAIVMASLRGMAAPKGLPPAIRDQWVSAVQKAVADPEFQTRAANVFAPLRYLPPTAYAAELKEAEAGFQQLWQVMPWGDK